MYLWSVGRSPGFVHFRVRCNFIYNFEDMTVIELVVLEKKFEQIIFMKSINKYIRVKILIT